MGTIHKVENIAPTETTPFDGKNVTLIDNGDGTYTSIEKARLIDINIAKEKLKQE